ncbi:MAG: hypothetical protein ACLS6O_04015 [Bifidobacterium sp.]
MAWTGGYGMKLNNYNRFVDNIRSTMVLASTSRASLTSGPARTVLRVRMNPGLKSS